jgi:Fibronectin type III domain/GDSL-like Lipase/Acylhydrolase
LRLTWTAACFGLTVSLLTLGCSEPLSPPESSAVAADVVAAASPAPTSLSATASSPTGIALTWTDNSPDETGFEIWRSTTGVTGTYSKRKTTLANAGTATDSGLSPGTEYCYKVRAVGGAGSPSSFSNSSCATTPLKAPTSLVASVAGSSALNLTWVDNSANESGFQIYRSTTGASGTYSLRVTVGANTTAAVDSGLESARQYCYRVRAIGSGSIPRSSLSNSSCATTPSGTLTVRIVLFGDSNTDRCEEQPPASRLSSYVSVVPRLKPGDPPLSCSVAGKVDAAWKDARTEALRVVNHGIASSTTGGGGFGGPNRTSRGSPNARTKVGAYTRFQGEVLGKGYPWSGGEPTNSSFPTGPVLRVNAFTPGANDFVYVSMGTNDDAGPTRTMTPAQTEANLRYMIQQWTGAGRRADHFIITTLAPRDDANSATSISDRNVLIRALAAELGVHLIDLADHTSDDNGATWRSPSLNIGDGIHYTEAVRAWLGDQIVSWMSARTAATS